MPGASRKKALCPLWGPLQIGSENPLELSFIQNTRNIFKETE